jgi:tRNA A22 N-methylase
MKNASGSLSAVRLTEFWRRMEEQFGQVYAQSVAKDYVLAGLGGRTITQALADGEDVKVVWRAVCAAFDVPDRLR